MEHFITPKERSYIRWALSDAFVDNDVDYAAIAREVQNFDQEKIKEILFSEVAPVCHANLESTLPSIWSCFNQEELEKDIEKMLYLRKQSSIRQLLDSLIIKWLRYRYKYIWVEISKKP
ncbi:hypothetical protein ACIOYV_28070 [Pseudomonas sp. NPDC087342]|uniref:DUF7079 family protein n=1 Tax=Pseudomonas sp. NPDC087342 TaxID=3364437 RepID=UPI003820FF0C